MPDYGIGTPYWYEWKIGLIECLKMMSDYSVESVTLQSSAFQSLDDVVVKYTDGRMKNIQVKHTDKDNNLTFSFLEPEIKKWAKEWHDTKTKYRIDEICVMTNKELGTMEKGGKCSILTFITTTLPALKKDHLYKGNKKEATTIKWFKDTIALSEKDTQEFIKILEFKNESDLAGLDIIINDILMTILGTDREDIIRVGRERLFSRLETWATSRREKEEIYREDIYSLLGNPSCTIPKHELCPEKPIFSSRIDFANSFRAYLQNTDKKIIYLKGDPGTGKTNFVSYLAQEQDSIVDFRYYTYLPVDKDSPCFTDDDGYYSGRVLWISILSQIKKKFEELNILSELKFPLIYDHLQVKDLRSIVLDYLPIYSEKLGRTCYIFIDGIDHAARASDKKETFLSQIPQPDTIHGDVKFVLVGQSIDNEDINRLVSDENAVCKSLPGLKEQDIRQLIEYENIEIENVDLDTLSSSIISVVGNNALNVIFAIYEIKKMTPPIDFDSIISRLTLCGLNEYITKYYEWIISSIKSIDELNLLRIETIFAFSSIKHQADCLATILEIPKLNVEFILNELYPLINKDNYGYAPLHNDFRLYLRDKIRENRNYSIIVDSIVNAVLKNSSLDEYKYDLVFNLMIDTQSIDKLFEFFNPDYIIKSVYYSISIDKLLEQFSSVTDLINSPHKLDYIHPLNMVATSISQLISCVQYYEKEEQFIENKMPCHLTQSEKYTLDFKNHVELIINDVYLLLLAKESVRSSRLYKEYFGDYDEQDLIALINELDESNSQKMGYIIRCYAPNLVDKISDYKFYASFITGWLEASVGFTKKEDITVTLSFKTYYDLDLYNYISKTIVERDINKDSIELLSEKLCDSSEISVQLLTELCFHMILQGIIDKRLQNKISELILSLPSIPSLDYKAHGVIFYFEAMFCLFNIENDIDWDALYDATLNDKHVSKGKRGFEPAHIFKDLTMKIFSMFYGKKLSYDEMVAMTYNLFGFLSHHGTGSCNDFGAFEVLPYIKKVFLQFFIDNTEFSLTSRLCEDVIEIFIGSKPHYYKELAYLYYISKRKDLFLQIEEHWCGINGILWKMEYDVIESVGNNIITILNQFGELTLSQVISTRIQSRILGYVGHKDYSLHGLLDCYQFLPLNDSKLSLHGMDLLTISDYANKMGDNRIHIEDELFDVAIKLGYKYVDALFEIKNYPEEFLFWRKTLISALFRHAESLFHTDEELIQLYRLVNAWINYMIESSSIRYRSDAEALYSYNNTIISMINNPSLKETLISYGNCSPNDTTSSEYTITTNNDENYGDLLERIKQSGYNHEIEMEINSILKDLGSSSCRLILNIIDILCDKEKIIFKDNIVLPYLHSRNKYGFRFNGNTAIISALYQVLTLDDWFSIFMDVSNRFSADIWDIDNFYSIYDDLEYISLYYNYQFNPSKIELIYSDLCRMHYSIISAAGNFTISKRTIILDPNITTFRDFVSKQIGDGDITIDDQIENTSLEK